MANQKAAAASPSPEAKPASKFQRAIEILIDAKEQIKEIFNDGEHGMLALNVETQMTQQINRLAHLGNINVTTVGPADFPPITNFMGEEISIPTAISAADLTPRAADKAAFIQKVDSLYAQFETLEPESMLNSYQLADDQMVIRGVAKKAGMDVEPTTDITLDFLDKVGKKVAEHKAATAEQKRVDEEVKRQQHVSDLKASITEVEEKRKGLDTDLADANAEFNAAKTEPALKKAEQKVAGIQQEITAADQRIQELTQQLTTLSATQP